MWRYLGIAVLAMTAAWADAQAEILYSNLGPNDEYKDYGVLIGYPIPTVNYRGFSRAESFTLSGLVPARLDSIEVALGAVRGPEGLDFCLMSEVDGRPGAVIESFHISAAQIPDPEARRLWVLSSVLTPLLSPDTEYFIAGSPSAPHNTAQWLDDIAQDTGGVCRRFNDNPWEMPNPSSYRGAMRINGSSVPEPSTLAMFLGLGGMGLVAAWRRRRRTA